MRIGGYDVNLELKKYEEWCESSDMLECMECGHQFEEDEAIYNTELPQCPRCRSLDVI